MRVEREGGSAAWLVGTLAVPTVQGHSASAPGVMVLSESFFKPVVAGNQSFSIAPLFQALRGLPFLGYFSVVWSIRHIEGGPGWGPTL